MRRLDGISVHREPPAEHPQPVFVYTEEVPVRKPHYARQFFLITTGIVSIAFGIGFIALPYLPQLTGPKPLALSHAIAYAADVPTRPTPTPTKPDPRAQYISARPATFVEPSDNELIIPSIGVDETIVEGSSDGVLDSGVWHRPGTSSPNLLGNTVLAGHRYAFLSGPKTLYFLDRVSVEDEMIVAWKGSEYHYQVDSSTVVLSTDIAIEASSPTAKLTVYTCTPIWSETNRLVVTGHLVDIRPYPTTNS